MCLALLYSGHKLARIAPPADLAAGTIAPMSMQPSVGKPMVLSDSEDEDELFSDKVQDRLSASATDCCIVSEDGIKYPVHKTKLREQSKVLRQVSMHVGTDTVASPCDNALSFIQ